MNLPICATVCLSILGTFSLLERGEWVMNREAITPEEMEDIARKFDPEKFNADEICQLAVDGGMRVPKCEHPRYDPVAPDIKY